MQAAYEFELLSEEGISGHKRSGLARLARSPQTALQVKDQLLFALIGGDVLSRSCRLARLGHPVKALPARVNYCVIWLT